MVTRTAEAFHPSGRAIPHAVPPPPRALSGSRQDARRSRGCAGKLRESRPRDSLVVNGTTPEATNIQARYAGLAEGRIQDSIPQSDASRNYCAGTFDKTVLMAKRPWIDSGRLCRRQVKSDGTNGCVRGVRDTHPQQVRQMMQTLTAEMATTTNWQEQSRARRSIAEAKNPILRGRGYHY